jgi:hypothetical protein
MSEDLKKIIKDTSLSFGKLGWKTSRFSFGGAAVSGEGGGYGFWKYF